MKHNRFFRVMFCYVLCQFFSSSVMLCSVMWKIEIFRVMLSIFSLKRQKCALIMRFVNSKCPHPRVRSKVDSLGSKWTVQGGGVQLDGPNDLKWTVLSRSGRSKRLKVNGLRKWTVQREKTVRSGVMNLDGLKGLK